jgi:hypothetical protein
LIIDMNSDQLLLDCRRRFMAFFVETAERDDVPICPRIFGAVTLRLTRMVYQETYDYRALQISLFDEDEAQQVAGNFEHYTADLGRSSEIELLDIKLVKVPTRIEPFWEIRRGWMSSRGDQREAAMRLVEQLSVTRDF